MLFLDRIDAGEKLAKVLLIYKGKDTVIYGLPRGGVVTASVIARVLKAPLDVVIVRKIGHPNNPEYAIAAISQNGRISTDGAVSQVGRAWFAGEAKKQKKEARRRKRVYLKGKNSVSAQGKLAILVDDGIATGLTMKAAIDEIRSQKPKKIIVAVPVVPRDVFEVLKKEVDTVVALEIPKDFLGAVGTYYELFPQVDDEEVINLLRKK